jgi:hypothetical protein
MLIIYVKSVGKTATQIQVQCSAMRVTFCLFPILFATILMGCFSTAKHLLGSSPRVASVILSFCNDLSA